ncbi:MAG: hypothetical protein U0527_14095 [Candidatus Eisenbacteria bacterium]
MSQRAVSPTSALLRRLRFWPVGGLCAAALCFTFVPVRADDPSATYPRTLLLSFDPILESQGGVRLHQHAGWNDPGPLTQTYLDDLASASHGWYAPRLTQSEYVDAYPLKVDGFRYTDTSYLSGLHGGGWHSPDGIDYKAVARDYDLARRVDFGELDEVVLHGAPYFGYYESRMAGQGGYWCNAPQLPRVACSRIFVMMGLNYERGVGEEIHSFGHRTESILARTFGTWDITQSRHDWERFTHNIGQSPDAACGDVHFPPNGTSDYDYANPNFVTSTAIDWANNFPNLTGQTSLVNRDTWGGADYQRNYLRWWYEHLPHAAGANDHDGLNRWNSWWPYVTDFNRWPEAGGDHLLGGPAPPAVPLGSGTFELSFVATGDCWSPRGFAAGAVWSQWNGHDFDIWYLSGDVSNALSSNTGDDLAPEVNDQGQVVWQGFDGQDWEIFTREVAGGAVHQITNNTTDDWHPKINASGRIVWDRFDGQDYEIFSSSFEGTGVVQVTNNSATSGQPRDDVWPEINAAGRVVWFGHDGNDWEIFSADATGGAILNLSNNAIEDEYPKINSSGRVVWHAWQDNNNTEIWSANATGGIATRISNNSLPDWYPEINALGRVVWMERDATGDWEIRAANADGSNQAAITDNDAHDQYPKIDDSGRVDWQGFDGHDWEIYQWSGGTVYQVTDNESDDRAVDLGLSGGAVWHGEDLTVSPSRSVIRAFGVPSSVPSSPASACLALASASPNPFTRATSLRFVAAAGQDVTLSIFDLTGRELRRLHEEVATGAVEWIEWDPDVTTPSADSRAVSISGDSPAAPTRVESASSAYSPSGSRGGADPRARGAFLIDLVS